jgi:pimeloyl-ACP methyl ester carboxylesterase
VRVRRAPLHPDAYGPPTPRIDEADLASLHKKTTYEVTTADGWTLVITRYRPVPQPFAQPIFGEPMLLVHGFSQNRHAFTCGEFVKHMLFYGADIHILELRGHGLSSVALQHEKARQGAPLPSDIDYGWDIDSYFLQDIPAAVAAVKQLTKRDKIFYCGHSMGGMLGYGYAGISDDLAGLVTVGAPADPGKGFLPLRVLAYLGPPFEGAVDGVLAAAYAQAWFAWALRRAVRSAAHTPLLRPLLAELLAVDEAPPSRRRFRYYPLDLLLKQLERTLSNPQAWDAWGKLARYYTLLANPGRMTAATVLLLLREGGEREPRGVVSQFARWIRRGELACYRTGYDFKRAFARIEIPMAIIFGDLDPLASIRSTQAIYRAARSEYLLWRPVKGNSHLELTMGRDIRQICFDIKNLIEFARKR